MCVQLPLTCCTSKVADLTPLQGFLREDMETQREIYRSDQEADRVSVKRLLRDCLRKNDIQRQISKLAPEETSALISAIKLVSFGYSSTSHVN